MLLIDVSLEGSYAVGQKSHKVRRSPEELEGMVVTEGRSTESPCRPCDGHRAAEVDSAAVKRPGQRNRVKVRRRDDIGSRSKILRTKRKGQRGHQAAKQNFRIQWHGEPQTGKISNPMRSLCTRDSGRCAIITLRKPEEPCSIVNSCVPRFLLFLMTVEASQTPRRAGVWSLRKPVLRGLEVVEQESRCSGDVFVASRLHARMEASQGSWGRAQAQ